MLQKMELQQLQELSLDEIKSYKQEAVNRKSELEEIKAKGGKDWSPALQKELDELVIFLVDIDEVIDEKLIDGDKKIYAPAKGTEKMVHVSIVRGRRFNPNTGKEESKPYVQVFTFAEWQLFKKNFRDLGYTIMEVLHDPYNEASKFVAKS